MFFNLNLNIIYYTAKPRPTTAPAQCTITRNSSEESEGVDEEKLYLDRSTSEKGSRVSDIQIK